VAQGTATTTGISKLQKSNDNISANTTGLRGTFTQQARVATTAFHRMEASSRTRSNSLNENITGSKADTAAGFKKMQESSEKRYNSLTDSITVNTTATRTGFQEMKTLNEAQSNTLCDGFRRLESSAKTQSDSLQDTLNS
jgi:hypothetical protein